eukprot:5335196-Alexandrium_andersonii.AAC.1
MRAVDPAHCGVCPREEAHCFWHDGYSAWPESGCAVSKCAPVFLPDSFRVGIRSAVRVSGLSVVLWTYQPLRDVPEGVE